MSHWIAEGKTYDVEEYCPYCDEMIPIIIDLGDDHDDEAKGANENGKA